MWKTHMCPIKKKKDLYIKARNEMGYSRIKTTNKRELTSWGYGIARGMEEITNGFSGG